jgi:hypothetical protein
VTRRGEAGVVVDLGLGCVFLHAVWCYAEGKLIDAVLRPSSVVVEVGVAGCCALEVRDDDGRR